MFLEEKLLPTRYNLKTFNVESKDLSYELATFFVLWKSILYIDLTTTFLIYFRPSTKFIFLWPRWEIRQHSIHCIRKKNSAWIFLCACIDDFSMDLIIFSVLASTTFSGGLIKKQLNLKETIFKWFSLNHPTTNLNLDAMSQFGGTKNPPWARPQGYLEFSLWSKKKIDRRPIFVHIY